MLLQQNDTWRFVLNFFFGKKKYHLLCFQKKNFFVTKKWLNSAVNFFRYFCYLKKFTGEFSHFLVTKKKVFWKQSKWYFFLPKKNLRQNAKYHFAVEAIFRFWNMMFSKTAVNPLRKKESQNLGFFTHFLGIFCQNANFSGYTEISELKIFLVKDICSYKSILYYWPKSALESGRFLTKTIFFQKWPFFGMKFRGLAEISDKKKCQKFLLQKIFSQKNIGFA